MAAADGEAVDPGDHRLGHFADQALQLFHRQADEAAAVVLAFMGALVAAGAEGLVSRAGEDDDADGLVPAGAVEGVDQLHAGLAAKGVVAFRAIDGDGGDAVFLFVQDVFVVHVFSPGFLGLINRPWSVRRTR
ncbi:hypothetical protein D3C77_566440 [compost metagenome]